MQLLQRTRYDGQLRLAGQPTGRTLSCVLPRGAAPCTQMDKAHAYATAPDERYGKTWRDSEAAHLKQRIVRRCVCAWCCRLTAGLAVVPVCAAGTLHGTSTDGCRLDTPHWLATQRKQRLEAKQQHRSRTKVQLKKRKAVINLQWRLVGILALLGLTGPVHVARLPILLP